MCERFQGSSDFVASYLQNVPPSLFLFNGSHERHLPMDGRDSFRRIAKIAHQDRTGSRYLANGLCHERQVHPQDLQGQIKIEVRQRIVGAVNVVVGVVGPFDGQDGRNVRI